MEALRALLAGQLQPAVLMFGFPEDERLQLQHIRSIVRAEPDLRDALRESPGKFRLDSAPFTLTQERENGGL